MSDTVRWCFTHKLQVSGNRQWCINGGHQEVSKCDVADMVPVRADKTYYTLDLTSDAHTSADILDAYVTLKRYGRLVRVGEGTE